MLTDDLLYKTLDENPGSTARDLAEKLGYSYTYVKNRLCDLKSAGEVYFERVGYKGKSATGLGHQVRWYP